LAVERAIAFLPGTCSPPRLEKEMQGQFKDDDRFTRWCSWEQHDSVVYRPCQRNTQGFGLSKIVNHILPDINCDPEQIQSLPVWTCIRQDVRAIRYGPVHSFPMGFSFFADHDISFLFRAGDQIVSYLGDVLTQNGQQIGLPPLHIHHIHVQKRAEGDPSYQSNLSDFHFFNTHGDFTFGDDYGIGAISARGYQRDLPTGFSLQIDDKHTYHLLALVDDVRMLDNHAPVVYFLEVAFRLTKKHTREASYFWMHNPGKQAGNFFLVPNYPSIAWWSGSVPWSGSMLGNGWFHTHRMRQSSEGIVVLRGSFEALGLSCSLLGIRHSNVLPDEGGGPRVRSTMFNATALYAILVQQHSDEIICRTDPAVAAFTTVTASTIPGISNGSRFDRRGGILCNPWTFRRDDIWTVFAFFEAQATKEAPWFPEHTVFHFYAELSHSRQFDGPLWGHEFNACPSASKWLRHRDSELPPGAGVLAIGAFLCFLILRTRSEKKDESWKLL